MINTITWVPGTRENLDSLFEELRQEQNSDTDHSLHQNYIKEAFQECSALTITFDNNIPICCSGILQRAVWPNNSFRILNRFWKTKKERFVSLNTHNKMIRISDSIKHQLEYAEKNLEAKLVFISRHQDNWQEFMLDVIRNNTGYVWNADLHNLYQTCDNAEDITCWQKIIYYGDSKLLDNWNKK
jgi:hypothetical protein